MSADVNMREVALGVLLEVLERDSYLSPVLSSALEKYQYLDKQDRAFLARLTEGVVERRITLDYIINQYSKVKTEKMKPVIRTILRMGVYQLRFMDQVPDSAACNESVKLAVKKGFGSLRGFVNGVLRGIARGTDTMDDAGLSVKYSMPQWLVDKWELAYGIERTRAMLASFLENKKTHIRCREGEEERILQSLLAEGIQAEKGAYLPYALTISGYNYLRRVKVFQEGGFQVQDESSMLIGECAGIQSGYQIVDVCAAPGGKASHAAEKLQGTGLVSARDLSERKTEKIRENIKRLGLVNVEVKEWDALTLDEAWRGKADIVLADLPCSGLGVIGKKPDIKYRASQEGIEELRDLQRQILSVVQEYVKPGGILMYSTCTVCPEENQENAAWFSEMFDFEALSLQKELPEPLKGELSEEGFLQLYPGVHACDGFFLAKFRKK